jgi:glucokinase
MARNRVHKVDSLMGAEVLLAGDIGGTKTDLAFFDSEGGLETPRRFTRFASAEYPSLLGIIEEFREANHDVVSHACFAVAGPVLDGSAKVSNLPWTLDAAEISEALRIPSVTLVNDLVATALSIPLLAPAEMHTIGAGNAASHATVAVIAPGTGLGEAFLTWEGGSPRAHPSEGGHSDFAPADELQSALLAHLRERWGHVSIERVCSGNGIPNIYDFLRDSRHDESAVIRRRLQDADDPTPIIVRSAMQAPIDPLCSATMEVFVDILGAEAGNLALKVLSTGGVYLAGGIPKRIVPLLAGPRFLNAFRAKGRMEHVLAEIPIHVVLEQTALIGCASLGLQQMEARRAGAPAATRGHRGSTGMPK